MNQNQKICFITGANAGIGKAAAIQLAEKGFLVLIGSRDWERGQVALNEIKKAAQSEFVELIEIDLSLKSSIQKAVNEIKLRYVKLDVLIHNAADFDIARKKPQITAEGIESIWATNHIGPVMLTNELLPLLEKSEQGRIITIASQGLVLHPNLKVDLLDPEFKLRPFSVPKGYYHSKLAQVMYTYWLAKKLSDTKITVNCIRVTNVKIDIARYPNISGLMKFMYSIKSKFSIRPEEMAATYTYLASSVELKRITGKYFNEKNQMVSSSRYSNDEKSWEEVMSLTKKYLA